MHTRGLKLGIYEDFGSLTCGNYPGSEFYMELDANTFAEWNVDMVKFDGCNSDPHDLSIGRSCCCSLLCLTPACTRTHKNDHVRTLKTL